MEMTIGEKSKELRVYYGWSQKHLTRLVGSSNYKLILRLEKDEQTRPPLTVFTDRLEEIYKIMVHSTKNRVALSCELCHAVKSMDAYKYDKNYGGRVLCKGCFHTLYQE